MLNVSATTVALLHKVRMDLLDQVVDLAPQTEIEKGIEKQTDDVDPSRHIQSLVKMQKMKKDYEKGEEQSKITRKSLRCAVFVHAPKSEHLFHP